MLRCNGQKFAYSVSEIMQTCEAYAKSGGKVVLVEQHVQVNLSPKILNTLRSHEPKVDLTNLKIVKLCNISRS